MMCYLSERGHNNFYYATDSRAILKDGAHGQELPWVSGNQNKNLKAIKVKKKFVIPLTHDNKYVNNIIDNDECYVVVWIKKEYKCQSHKKLKT
tara:strand:- start:2692 stop:2970 length:279 start_codon:yes stop_codon:yes gene_type:complete